jgi:hypothetical protein
MATQRVIVAKIGGPSGDAVFQRLRKCRVQSRSSSGKPHRDEGKDSEANADLRRLVSSLRSHAHTPPVVFFSEYADCWSMGDVFDRPFGDCHGRRILRIDGGSLKFIAYRLPDGGHLERVVRSQLRRKHARERTPQETSWYLMILLECLLSWEGPATDAVLVLIRDIKGGLVMDSEVEEAMNHVPKWLAANERKNEAVS